jgi:hypothetical protein
MPPTYKIGPRAAAPVSAKCGERLPKTDRPNIDVRYRVFPAGYVIPYNAVNDDDSHKHTIGLIRTYFIDWTIAFRAADDRPVTEYRTETRPGPKDPRTNKLSRLCLTFQRCCV